MSGTSDNNSQSRLHQLKVADLQASLRKIISDCEHSISSAELNIHRSRQRVEFLQRFISAIGNTINKEELMKVLQKFEKEFEVESSSDIVMKVVNVNKSCDLTDE